MRLSPFPQYPLRVTVFKKFGGSLKPVADVGRYEKERKKTENGFIENNFLHLKNQKVKIPQPENKYYYDLSDRRHIFLLQIDRHTFYPISFENDKMTVTIKKPILDKEGVPEKDDFGNPTFTEEERILFDSDLLLTEGNNLVQIPSMLANKTYDKEHWLSNEIETAQRVYKTKNFWEQYGDLIKTVGVGFIMVLVLYVGVQGYADITTSFTNAQNVALAQYGNDQRVASDNWKVGMELLANAIAQSNGQTVVLTDAPPV